MSHDFDWHQDSGYNVGDLCTARDEDLCAPWTGRDSIWHSISIHFPSKYLIAEPVLSNAVFFQLEQVVLPVLHHVLLHHKHCSHQTLVGVFPYHLASNGMGSFFRNTNVAFSQGQCGHDDIGFPHLFLGQSGTVGMDSTCLLETKRVKHRLRVKNCGSRFFWHHQACYPRLKILAAHKVCRDWHHSTVWI